MRFLHTSDWHLGRQFHGHSLLEDQRHVLAQLVAHAREQAVDAVLIAGDIYDRSVPPAAAVELLDAVLRELCEALALPVLLIPGNHDSAERLRFGAAQLKRAGLHILGDLNAVTTPVEIAGVRFYGIPYNDPELVRATFGCEVGSHDAAHRWLLEQIAAADDDRVPRVLLSHCFIDGAESSESERPLSIGGADRVDYQPFAAFDYVALGHLHSPQFRGAEHIRYSGSLLKYSFSEQHQNKSVTLVEIDAGRRVSATTLPLTPLRDMRVLEGELAELLAAGKTDPHADDYLLVRLHDRTALLDPMGKLREVYPNVLHLEKPGLMATGGGAGAQREQLKRGELALFRDFFQQVAGQALSAAQERALRQTLEQLHKTEAGR